jgi:DNA adenine methylase
MRYNTPLRYPGGKAKIANYIKLILRQNELYDVDYIEPYAGGAGVALSLLYESFAQSIHINDLDRSVYAFWWAVLNETDAFCDLIQNTPLTVTEWYRQKEVQQCQETAEMLELGFSTFFLNRTSRSGIVHKAGIIGGKYQTGMWKIDARFNREELKLRVKQVARYRNRIHLYNLDATDFLQTTIPNLGDNAFAYLDPPYYVKGQELYRNSYVHDDHATISKIIAEVEIPWVVSYDNTTQICNLYSEFQSLEYGISYSAALNYVGDEVMFFSNNLEIPRVENPTKVSLTLLNNQMSLFAAD